MSNIFEKIQNIRVKLNEQNLKPTGKNEYAKYNYFELDDFLPQLNKLMQKYKMTAIASFTNEVAILTAIDYESAEQYSITSPFGTAELKGCHEVQNIGAVETYQRRYLYQTLFDIGESDCLNATQGKDKQDNKSAPKQPAKPENKPIEQKNAITLAQRPNILYRGANTQIRLLRASLWIISNG